MIAAVPAPMTKSIGDGMVGTGKWRRIRHGVTMDSGATVDIMPESYLPHVNLQPCTGVRAGRKLVAANNTPIAEIGEKHVKAVTNTGQ